MAAEKKIALQTFTGGINTVTADELLPSNQVRYMYNCNVLSQGEGNVGIVTNVKGNKQVSFALPEGENECIGTAVDEENNRFFFFIWNNTLLHGIYMYEGVSQSITLLFQNLTNTGNLNILNFQKSCMILHAYVIKGQLYWAEKCNPARKLDIDKVLNKESAYNGLIREEYIDAYKRTSPYAPVLAYGSDPSKGFNKLYGAIRKACVRYIYDNGEYSNWSDFSKPALPAFESFTGINTIPTDNNYLAITFNTGDATVVAIQIAILATNEELTDGTLPWGIVATIKKDELGIGEYADYTYGYYNETAPVATDQALVYRPYSYLPKNPACMVFTKNRIIYGNFKEGFDKVMLNVSTSVSYKDLFINDEVENELNNPQFIGIETGGDYVTSREYIWDVNNVRSETTVSDGAVRYARHTLTIGQDVKRGNVFTLRLFGGYNGIITARANISDSATTIAHKIKTSLVGTGRIYRKTEELPDTNIYTNFTDPDGNVSFSYIIRADRQADYTHLSTNVERVSTESLKDNGKSVPNMKLGSSNKYGIMYEDFYGRKSLVYTNNSLTVNIATINDLGGMKAPLITMTIDHRPPIWARRYQIMRSPDLIYGRYIQMLIQKVVAFEADDERDYLDLLVGSLPTYKKIHPNSPLSYEFKKGDRIRLIKKFNNDDSETYYANFETEIVAYNETVTDRERSNIKTNGTNEVEVEATTAKEANVGKFIIVDGAERLIISADTINSKYTLDATIGDTTTPKTYLFYDLVDRRGSLRIRKPQGFDIADNSLVELYEPAGISNAINDQQFFEFDKKFEIINAGTENAYHAGDTQSQSDSQPAILTIGEGTAYVRNRELPTNNSFPGTQLEISVVEDASYSDFYSSIMNDNGRVNIEDDGSGEKEFGSRLRYSGNYIEDTRINGLNDFNNTDREDYNDIFGNIQLLVFDTNIVYLFKELKTAYVPVDSRLAQDNSGIALNITTNKFLNPIQYLAWEGGIGNNPESYAENGTHKYFVSANSGVIVRLGGNGIEPISKTYALDNEVKRLLADAYRNGAYIIGGFDSFNGGYIVAIRPFDYLIYQGPFSGWTTQENNNIPEEQITAFEVVSPPANGTVEWDGLFINYQSNTGYTGSDPFSYRVQINGVWSEVINDCITVTTLPTNYVWRAKESSFFCIDNGEEENTGMKGWSTLELYDTVSETVQPQEKPNTLDDPDYIAPVYNTQSCQLPVPEPGSSYLYVNNTNANTKLSAEIANGPPIHSYSLIDVAANTYQIIYDIDDSGPYYVKVTLKHPNPSYTAVVPINGTNYTLTSNVPQEVFGLSAPIIVGTELVPL